MKDLLFNWSITYNKNKEIIFSFNFIYKSVFFILYYYVVYKKYKKKHHKWCLEFVDPSGRGGLIGIN